MLITRNRTPSREGVLFCSGSEALAALALASASYVLFRIYALGFTFGASFDDAWNLAGLEHISGPRSALEFVFGGVAGPLGRPLALLTFLPQWYSWPSAPQDFLYQNALIHLLNLQLVTWIAFRLARYMPWAIRPAHWFALSVGLLWGFSPLLFSTSAMIIQRMTSLSAMFSLLGCLGYLIGREQILHSFNRGLILMSVSVGGGTLLAALCKENGAILPGLILVLESLIAPKRAALRSSEKRVLFRRWRIVFLVLPTAVVIAYLTLNFSSFLAGHQGRPFSLGERLLTESRILLQYVKLLFFPVRSELAPFNDAFPISKSLLNPLTTLISTIVVGTCGVFAWRWRCGSLRVFSFAVGWFLWGHVTESTVVPLELYFEHRNYLPAFGPLLACVAVIFHPHVAAWLRNACLTLILGASIFILRESAVLWGDARVAAASWYQRHPASLRSLQFYLIKLSEQRRYDEYLRVIDSVTPPLSDTSEYAVMKIVGYCGLRSAGDVASAADLAVQRLRVVPSNSSVTDLIDKLADGAVAGKCPGLSVGNVNELLNAIVENESERIRADVRAQAHEILARLILPERNLDKTMYHLESSFGLRPTLSVGIAMASILTSAQLYEEADHKLDELEALEPKRPFVRNQWRRSVDEMRVIVEQQKSLSQR